MSRLGENKLKRQRARGSGKTVLGEGPKLSWCAGRNRGNRRNGHCQRRRVKRRGSHRGRRKKLGTARLRGERGEW